MCQARFKILMGSIFSFSLFFSFLFDRGPASAFEELAMLLTHLPRPPDRNPTKIQKGNRDLPGELRQGVSRKGFCGLSPFETVSTENSKLTKRTRPNGAAGRSRYQPGGDTVQQSQFLRC